MINQKVIVTFDLGNTKDEVDNSVKKFFSQAQGNDFVFIDELSLEKVVSENLEKGFIAVHVKKDEKTFTLELTFGASLEGIMHVVSLDPVRLKKGLGSKAESIDLAHYVEIALQLCDNFAIFELRTEKL